MKLKQLTDKKRNRNKYLKKSLLRVVYGVLLVTAATVLVSLDPITIATDWYLDMTEESFFFNMWQAPTYEVFVDVWVYNYTNAQDYIRGDSKTLKLQEIGPFKFREIRTNENVSFVKERRFLSMRPKTKLHFLEEESVSKLNDLTITVPNIVLIALSTLAADQLGYVANSAIYYTLSASGPTLFKDLTVEQLLWGYEDPILSVTNNILPGWIDFDKLGILDRFYVQRPDELEIDLVDQSKKYSISSWNDSPGLKEQGFTDVNTSTPCNLIKGSYEGFMLTPGYPKGQDIRIYRKQACRIYPFLYQREFLSEYGFSIRRYVMSETAFSKTSPYICSCSYNCLPEGFVDAKHCYYGFPIALSKPHFQDVDPLQRSYFEGMTPNPEEHTSFLHVEPVTGVPIALQSHIQVNLAVRMSPGNPITKPLKDKVLPLIWLSIYCTNPAPDVISLLRMRFVVAPPLVMAFEVILFIVGFLLGVYGFYGFWKINSNNNWQESVEEKGDTEHCNLLEKQTIVVRRRSSNT